MHKGQAVLPAMIVVYAVVTLILAATNVMLVMLASLTFLHVQVSNQCAGDWIVIMLLICSRIFVVRQRNKLFIIREQKGDKQLFVK